MRIALALALSTLLFVACEKAAEQPAPEAGAPALKVAGAEEAPAVEADEAKPTEAAADEAAPGEARVDEAAVAAHEGPACGAGGDCAKKQEAHVEGGCEDIAAEQLEKPTEETVKRADGTEATHVGHAFDGAEKVAVSALLADPSAYKGKTVALEGDVSAMCGHKRGWFAVAAEDKSGRQVRILTAPTFLVPAGSVGRAAVAEGTVEVIEVAADHAKHLADEHKLGDPDKITANVQQVVIRARGAEFF